MKTIPRPKGWIKADQVRVVRNGGKLVVQIRRKNKNPARKPKANSGGGRKKAKAWHVQKMKTTGRYNPSSKRKAPTRRRKTTIQKKRGRR